jgi:SAM-dependent methyltransferase
MPQPEAITRREIKDLIRVYEERAAPDKGWYQNIRFMPLLETRRSAFDSLTAWIRGKIRKEELLVSNLPGLQGSRVIDIGCNAGLYSVEASRRGASFVLGVDQDPFRVEQANDVAGVFRRLGYQLGPIEFRVVDDINNHLDLLADKDVLIACCVLYHLGPLVRLKEAIVKGNVRTMVLQGNLARRGTEGLATGLSRLGTGEDVATREGLQQFCASMGFNTVKAVEHAFPLVIATR